MDSYGAAGGGLIAGGLAYAALFALVPAVLLVVGVAGIFISDPATRASLVDTISSVLPPLRDVATTVLDEASRDAGPVSVLGVIALLWGASRFVVAFQDATALVMGGVRRRSILRSNVGAFVAVLLFVLAILASTIVAGLLAFLEAGESVGILGVLDLGVSIALGVMPIVGAIVAVAIAYRIVPIPGPSWRSLILPAVVVGLLLTILARVFIFLSPRLIGAAALLGTLASVFAALAWLALSFQALLIGAAWTADRESTHLRGEASAVPREDPPPA
jgi:membrane protein